MYFYFSIPDNLNPSKIIPLNYEKNKQSNYIKMLHNIKHFAQCNDFFDKVQDLLTMTE